MGPRWQFILGSGGTREWSLSGITDRKLNVRLAASSQVEFTMDGRDDLAGRVGELSTDVHVLRTPASGPTDTLFRGRVGATSDQITADSHTLRVSAVDYREVLNRRILYASSQKVWTGEDQSAIAWGLIQQSQVRTGGNLGITRGLGQTTGVNRDRTYETGASVGASVQALSEVIGGFDWDVRPAGDGLKLDIFYPGRGEDRGVLLEYGGLVTGLTRDVDPAGYANAVRGTGVAPEGGGPEPAPAERQAANLATVPQGRWDRAVGTEQTTTAAVVDRTEWELGESQFLRPAYTLTLRPGAWTGPGHIWLGDTVRLVVRSGRLVVDTSLRVHEMGFTPVGDDDEVVTLTVGGPRPDYRRRATLTERRLANLERR